MNVSIVQKEKKMQKRVANGHLTFKTFTSFFKDKKPKKKTLSGKIQGFSYYFCLMMKGS
jgi:hypothetical protein